MIWFVPPSTSLFNHQESTRVRKLLTSLQSGDPRIIPAKTNIFADPSKRDDFEETANFLLIVAPPLESHGIDSRNISAMYSETPNRGSSGVELRFHTGEEYRKLTSAQKAELYQWRKEKKAKRG